MQKLRGSSSVQIFKGSATQTCHGIIERHTQHQRHHHNQLNLQRMGHRLRRRKDEDTLLDCLIRRYHISENGNDKEVYEGLKKSIDREAVQRLKADSVGATAIARRLGIGRASVYRVLAAVLPGD
jgi:DNA invertase Pin-like site-specific DNA recombinase